MLHPRMKKAPKGFLQILWEQDWINPNEIMNDYVKDIRKIWLDPCGKVLQEFENDAKTNSYQFTFQMSGF